jgi:hypothetical protein
MMSAIIKAKSTTKNSSQTTLTQETRSTNRWNIVREGTMNNVNQKMARVSMKVSAAITAAKEIEWGGVRDRVKGQRILSLPVVGYDKKKPHQQHVHLYVSVHCLNHERIRHGFKMASRHIVVSNKAADAGSAIAFVIYLAEGSLDKKEYQAEINTMIRDDRPYILLHEMSSDLFLSFHHFITHPFGQLLHVKGIFKQIAICWYGDSVDLREVSAKQAVSRLPELAKQSFTYLGRSTLLAKQSIRKVYSAYDLHSSKTSSGPVSGLTKFLDTARTQPIHAVSPSNNRAGSLDDNRNPTPRSHMATSVPIAQLGLCTHLPPIGPPRDNTAWTSGEQEAIQSDINTTERLSMLPFGPPPPVLSTAPSPAHGGGSGSAESAGSDVATWDQRPRRIDQYME